MSKFILILPLLLFVCGCGAEKASKEKTESSIEKAVITSSEIEYGTYINQRFQFKVKYPKELLYPGTPPDNNGGMGFHSKDDNIIRMSVWAGFNAVFETLEERLTMYLDEGDEVTYKKLRNNWGVMSGYKKNEIFYFKLFLYKQDKEDIGTFYGLFIHYPKSDKELWNKIVGICAKSFKRDESIEEDIGHIFK